ncbi:MAG: TlpA family protein disulfide reductase [Acidimicrobiia bacterium]
MGLGAQDTHEDALAFVDNYGTESFRMLYDASFESWSALGVRGQPTSILFDTDGRGHTIWYGPFDEAEVLELANSL